MAWRMRPVYYPASEASKRRHHPAQRQVPPAPSWLRGGVPPATASTVGPAAVVVAIVGGGMPGRLLLSAPVNGAFWWSDAPRHATERVFRKRTSSRRIRSISRFGGRSTTILRRPALTIMFYPPALFTRRSDRGSRCSASAISLPSSPSRVFVLVLGVSRLCLVTPVPAPVAGRRRRPAGHRHTGNPHSVGAAGDAGTLPAYGLIALSAVCLTVYVRKGRPGRDLFDGTVLAGRASTQSIMPDFHSPPHWRPRSSLPRDATPCATATPSSPPGLRPSGCCRRSLSCFGSAPTIWRPCAGLQGSLPFEQFGVLAVLPAGTPRPVVGCWTVLLGAGGFVLILKTDRHRTGFAWAYRCCWHGWSVGYLFFTLISLRGNTRHHLGSCCQLAHRGATLPAGDPAKAAGRAMPDCAWAGAPCSTR